jgi:hypothetical protein
VSRVQGGGCWHHFMLLLDCIVGRGEWVSTTMNELICHLLFGCHITDSNMELDSLSASGMGEMGSC